MLVHESSQRIFSGLILPIERTTYKIRNYEPFQLHWLNPDVSRIHNQKLQKLEDLSKVEKKKYILQDSQIVIWLEIRNSKNK